MDYTPKNNHSGLTKAEGVLFNQLKLYFFGNCHGTTSVIQPTYTKHFRDRANQRGITRQMVDIVLEFGTPFSKQGLTFYTIFKRDIPYSLSNKLKKKLKNLVLLLGSDGLQIMTGYKNDNPVKYIRKKSKVLS